MSLSRRTPWIWLVLAGLGAECAWAQAKPQRGKTVYLSFRQNQPGRITDLHTFAARLVEYRLKELGPISIERQDPPPCTAKGELPPHYVVNADFEVGAAPQGSPAQILLKYSLHKAGSGDCNVHLFGESKTLSESMPLGPLNDMALALAVVLKDELRDEVRVDILMAERRTATSREKLAETALKDKLAAYLSVSDVLQPYKIADPKEASGAFTLRAEVKQSRRGGESAVANVIVRTKEGTEVSVRRGREANEAEDKFYSDVAKDTVKVIEAIRDQQKAGVTLDSELPPLRDLLIGPDSSAGASSVRDLPRQIKGLERLGKAQVEVEDFRAAGESFDRAAALSDALPEPDRVRLLTQAGEAWYRARQFRSAAERYQEVVRLQPHSSEMYLRMTQSLRLSNQPAAARNAGVESLLWLTDDSPGAHLSDLRGELRALLYHLRGEEARLATIAASEPGGPGGTLRRAVAWEMLGYLARPQSGPMAPGESEYRQAIDLYAKVGTSEAARAVGSVRRQLAGILLRASKLDAAAGELEIHLKALPGDAQREINSVLEELAELDLDRGLYRLAERRYLELLKRMPNDASLRPALVSVYMELGQYENALKTLQEIGPTVASSPVRQIQLAIIQGRLGAHEEALGAFARAREIYAKQSNKRGESMTLQRTAAFHLQAGDLKEAEKLLDQALNLQLKFGYSLGEADSLQSVGELRESQDRLAEALDAYSRALKLRRELGQRKDQAVLLGRIGSVLAKLRRDEESWNHWLEGYGLWRELAFRPGMTEAWASLLRASEQNRQDAQAAEVRRIALDILALRPGIELEAMKELGQRTHQLLLFHSWSQEAAEFQGVLNKALEEERKAS